MLFLRQILATTKTTNTLSNRLRLLFHRHHHLHHHCTIISQRNITIKRRHLLIKRSITCTPTSKAMDEEETPNNNNINNNNNQTGSTLSLTFKPSRKATQKKSKRKDQSFFCPACNAECKQSVFRPHLKKCCPDIESRIGKDTWSTENMTLIMDKANAYAGEILEDMKKMAYSSEDDDENEQHKKGARMSYAEVAQKLNLSESRVRNALKLHIKSIPLTSDSTPIDIIFENDDVLVVNKPPYLRTHPIHRHTGTSLINRCITYLDGKECYVVHRLDMDTSGVILFCKNPLLTRGFAEQFMTREANKTYLALCVGVLPLGNEEPFAVNAPITSCIKCKEGRAISFASDDEEAKESRTTFDFFSFKSDDLLATENLPNEIAQGVTALKTTTTTISNSNDDDEAWKPVSVAALVLASPKTGRTHQIRVHLAHAGLPILGDMLYGPHARWVEPRQDAWSEDSTSKPRYKWSVDKPKGKWAGDLDIGGRQALHAYRLEITHPLTNEKLMFEAPLPEDMKKALRALGIEHR